MMESSPSKVNTLPSLPPPSMTGTKRPAPSLLPAFELLSSSPGFPRPPKRRARSPPAEENSSFNQKYPTPIPTSTTGILSSSPPRLSGRPILQRTQSNLSERAPLAALASVTLPENGQELLMGRSSNSSHHQLSSNRLISRVHVKARYIAASDPLETNKVEIICNGWNGVKVHCQGRTWELAKGDSFTSETEFAEIMLDVQDARVLVLWPNREQRGSSGDLTDSSWDSESSPTARIAAVASRDHGLPHSPIRRGKLLESPVSPTPGGNSANASMSTLFPGSGVHNPVKVYEDNPSSDDEVVAPQEETSRGVAAAPSSPPPAPGSSGAFSSGLSEPDDEEDDPDEENDPVVHSFGPFGANISNLMASFSAVASPEQRLQRGSRPPRRPLESSTSPPGKRSASAAAAAASSSKAENIPLINHVINQLAFSRLSSTPLSLIMNNLPASLKGVAASPVQADDRGLTGEELCQLLNRTRCIGEIHREGKDAAGKKLESEYYYVPDEDVDDQRRAAVVDGLRKPSLRNCRKQHKQYYWKKPRTP